MRDSNYRGKKQQKIIASQILLLKRSVKMMTKPMIPYIYLVCLISSLDLIAQCQCTDSSQSANSHQTTSEKPNYDVQEQSRKLSDDLESITSYTNLISDPNSGIIGDHLTKEFQYYNEPIEITTPRYDPPPSIEVPSNHQPSHPIDINQSYFPQLEPIPYNPNVQNIPNIPTDTYIAPPPIASGQNHLVKVIREPFWAPEVYKLENQYIDTFRSIKSSVMGMYYRMQNFVNYIMSYIFTIGKFRNYLFSKIAVVFEINKKKTSFQNAE